MWEGPGRRRLESYRASSHMSHYMSRFNEGNEALRSYVLISSECRRRAGFSKAETDGALSQKPGCLECWLDAVDTDWRMTSARVTKLE